jgi:23S rRNA (uracil1939-C5)-methyltransferase
MFKQTEIIKPLFGGSFLSFIEGKAVFTPFTAPGEILKIEITESKKDYDISKLHSILQASPSRIEPACPVFETCGGCSYQHVTYEAELEFKRSIIKDNLRRITGIKPEDQPRIQTISSDRFHYRSHASVKYDGENTGFYRKDSNELVPFPKEGCRLLAEELIRGLSSISDPGADEFKIAVDYSCNFNHSSGAGIVIDEMENGVHYKRDLFSFFQSNRLLREQMLKKVLSYIEFKNFNSAIDLGCGSGFFAIPASAFVKNITGVDTYKPSISFAGINKKLNSCENAVFKVMDMTHIIPKINSYDLVIADPPRSGLPKKTRNFICETKPSAVIYVSCDPTSWCRDIKDFLQAGFKLSELTFIDMFPCTDHIELISFFER